MALSVSLPNSKVASVSIKSLLISATELKEETRDAIRNACELAALQKAVDLWGPQQTLTVRDLDASDMSYTNNVFTETSNATGNQWNTMAFGAFTVATGTVVGIYGVKIYVVHDGTIDFPPLSGIRIDVGGARIAQWHVQQIMSISSAANVAPLQAIAGFTKSPIVAAEDITVTISEYTQTTSTVYYPVWLGVTVEKEGRTLKP